MAIKVRSKVVSIAANTATKVLDELEGRKEIRMPAPVDIYFGGDNTLTSSNGYRPPSGQFILPAITGELWAFKTSAGAFIIFEIYEEA